ncbi:MULTISPECIES: LPD29 domain-containing protein [Burkholderia]|uniref:LPD29 domain-containing protein n=1 Tax=Burkholderia TaxID=32008 RepID=UPI0001A4B86F|nr:MULTISPECIES: LPD29 domain-containing protein [Burkholderia]ACR29477.1 Hypothetical protein bglu_1g23960 [Burkholderia glumae BGR1]AOR66291.1 hypothetical protein BBJ41_01245 [Burkholderia stabilis]HDR9495440.1 hypothetical protein [Burkholderia stabilis]HDR9526355.1 hypothetical protein [Burkholderia stabilis]HDR9533668.1 hypothetical protein [Burkholderia stabilis]
MTTISRRETLSLVRKALHEAFPQTTFTLQPSRSKGNAACGFTLVWVKWIDGPSSSQVHDVVSRFEDRIIDWDRPTPWSNQPKANHLLDGHAVRFDVSFFSLKRTMSEETLVDVMDAAVKDFPTPYETTAIRYTTVVPQPSKTAERVQRVDQGAWERQELLDLAANAMVANGPTPTRNRARL